MGDEELDDMVKDVVGGNSYIGPNAVKARLMAHNVKV